MPAKSKVDAYCETWASSLALLLSRLSSGGWQTQPVTDAGDYTPSIRVRVAAGNGLHAQQWFGFREADAAGLLRISGQETSAMTEPDQGPNQAIVRLVQQWSDLAAGNLEADFGRLSLQAALEESHEERSRIAKLICVGNGS
ncbi:MAG TPA: hypothetical protein VN648_21220, partial [Candidatus Methylomirabilis sp.]|nr:hypothetical protein [Candidatus Methylomirabilis sp.]